MELRVLGPFEFERNGVQLHLARRQQRLVLGILALEANRIVTRDRLVDLLWGDEPPHQARSNLQSRVSELRAVVNIGDGLARLESATNGYRLRTPPGAVDVQVFRELLDRSNNETGTVAIRYLRQALELWRGPVLSGDARLATQTALCHKVEESRLTAAERLFDLELRAGNAAAIVDEISALTAEHPGRERLAGQLVQALHDSGRSAEALRTYERWRRSLADELGTDPSPELQALHGRILRSRTVEGGERRSPGTRHDRADEGNRFVPAVARLLPVDILDFTGRRAEISFLTGRLRPSGRDRAAVVTIAGLGGVGKTALAVHVAHQLIADFPDGQLYIDLHGFDTADPVQPVEALGRFLRALGVDGATIPTGLDERAELFRDLLADRSVLVVLDNATSAEQVIPLIPPGRTCGTLITGRTQVGALIGAAMLDLDVLPTDQAQDLLGRLAGRHRVRADPLAAAELCTRSSNLPLAVRIMGARLATKPHWPVAHLLEQLRTEGSGLDQFILGHLDVRATIAVSYRGLTAPAQRLLRLFHDLVGTDISPWLAAALTGLSHAEAEELLEQLVDAQLLNAAGMDAIGQARFRQHELIRLFASEQAEAEHQDQSGARDRSYSAWLALTDAACDGVYDGAHLAIRGSMPRRRVDERLEAATRQRPLDWFAAERAGIIATVRRAARHGETTACWELATVTAPLFEVQRIFDDWHAVLGVALEAVTKDGDRLGRAAVQHQMGKLHAGLQRPHDALLCFTEAQQILDELPGERLGWATATAYVAMARRFLGETDAAIDGYQQALAVFTDEDDNAGMAFAQRGIGQIRLDRGDLQAADGYLGRSLDACRAGGLRRLGAQSLFWLGTLRIKQDRVDEAETIFQEVLSATRALGDRTGEGMALRGLGLAYRASGQVERARTVLTRVLEMARQPRETLLESAIRRDLASLAGTVRDRSHPSDAGR